MAPLAKGPAVAAFIDQDIERPQAGRGVFNGDRVSMLQGEKVMEQAVTMAAQWYKHADAPELCT